MTKKVLLLHGWGGSEYPHWQSWLAGELAKEYGCVNFLKFSDFDNPKFALWKKELLQTLEDFKPDVVVCHSLANILWFQLANRSLLPNIQHLYLVAPPSLSCSIEALCEFFPTEVPKNLFAKKTTLIYSTNDPYMSVEEAEHLTHSIKAKVKVIENGGHINAESGFGKWEWILQEIRSITL
ncbi:MAG: alpha/beta hydrolase [Campylobacterales bacterium]|nr:alpha/beta hydrolase [Campylobacterales bacterium]